MNKRHPKSTFLPLKTILLLSLSISIGFQLIFFLSMFFGDTLFFHEIRQESHPSFPIGHVVLFFLYSFIISFLLFLYNRRIMGIDFKRKFSELLFAILGSILIAATLSIVFTLTQTLFDTREHSPRFISHIIRDGLIRDLSLMVVVILITNLLKSVQKEKTTAVENEVLRTENIRTRYEALKSQMDPHFLFNSLNTLQSLIDTDPTKAEDYVQQLSFVLRYTLQNKEVIPLEEELRCAQAYCEMMQIRYGDNLKFIFLIDPKYNNYKVLPLSIQGLIENAIKHNVISAKQPLHVTITSTEDAQIKVSNPIQPKLEEEPESGIGLANLAERYRLKWDREVRLYEDGKVFEVYLPIVE